MPRFAANISLLFTELSLEDRFEAAARAGFKGVEILFPYETPAPGLRALAERAGLEMVLINAPPPAETRALTGFAAVPRADALFQDSLKRVLRYAAELKPGLIHVMSGYCRGDDARETLVRNLQWAADFAPRQTFSIEPLNEKDQPGYFLNSYPLAMEVLEAVGRPNVGLQYDAYHAQAIHGDALGVWHDHAQHAIHAQIGAYPDRSEPGRGPVDFQELFQAIDDSGYAGWISAEYNPSTARTEESLSWLREFASGI
ncbi:MAG: TIM barrel protein [Rhodobacteraceae bacterium]|nr:TIM barrel protein [Paracoccaceae bacterium]